jgi:hypothetical protein
MARWDVYADCDGAPLYAQIDMDDDATEDEAWNYALEALSQTLEVTKEES